MPLVFSAIPFPTRCSEKDRTSQPMRMVTTDHLTSRVAAPWLPISLPAARTRLNGRLAAVLVAASTAVAVPAAAQTLTPPAQLRQLASGEAAPSLTVSVTPATVTLAPGQPTQFQAAASLPDAGPAAWSATGGTVTQTGLFIAGQTTGTFKVTAVRSGASAVATVVIQSSPQTPPAQPSTPPGRTYIYASPGELASRPTSGAAWSKLSTAAAASCGTPDLANQDDPTNVCVLAKALVFARTGDGGARTDVANALRSIASGSGYSGRALALGRELAAYVIAADLIDLPSYDIALDGQFRQRLSALLTIPTSSGPASLVECHEDRPNNWGTHCGASRAAVAAYLGNRAELERVAQVFKGWLGDRSSYAGFSYGDLSWQCNPSAPVAINPRGCTKDGRSLDGVLPDDQRRGGSFTWPAPQENYVYEALQGALLQAMILSRAGYDVFNWEDKALLRAYQWLHTVNNYPAASDDTWQPHVVNRVYGTSFPAPVPSSPGKNVGFTDWTHGAP